MQTKYQGMIQMGLIFHRLFIHNKLTFTLLSIKLKVNNSKILL
jgi:hypothetical protein